ncbi:hypothetical protein DFH09DRAFT_1390415 [Mycena vulgaris]|nr:hypothetical protein DFH09DRAFT_1390415 [Mycena vulgaris]
MQRWQEQGEQKLVELLRTMRSFAKMQSVWAELAERDRHQIASVARAYARQKASMYNRRRLEARKKIQEIGCGHLLEETANVVAFVEQERKKEAELMENGVLVVLAATDYRGGSTYFPEAQVSRVSGMVSGGVRKASETKSRNQSKPHHILSM